MANKRRAVTMAVDEILLLEDRAQVTRRGRLELDAGLHRLQVERVAPVLSDKTLAPSVTSGQARIVDTRVSRRAVHVLPDDIDDPTGEIAQLRREAEALESELEVCDAALRTAQGLAEGYLEASRLSLADLSEDVAWGRQGAAAWTARLDDLHSQELQARRTAIERTEQSRRLKRALGRKQQRLAALERPDEQQRADLYLDLHADAAGPVEIRVDYIVPNACWRPYHTAQLSEGDETRVVVSTDACVWQTTGEDWSNVQLVLSTERPSLGAEPPRLGNDRLSWQRKRDVVEVEARDETIDTAGLGLDEDQGPGFAPELPGIDDGGEPLEFRAPHRADVPSDGRPWRIALTHFETPADVERVAYPELTPIVIVKTVLTNRGDRPLLAGPVDLIAQSGFIGRTSVLFQAVGERFDLGWGPDPDLRIHREVEDTKEKSRALSSWNKQTRTVTLRLSNQGPETKRVTVTERVPISEIEPVRIDVIAKATSGAAAADDNGFVSWDVELAPRSRAKRVLAYAIARKDNVAGLRV